MHSKNFPFELNLVNVESSTLDEQGYPIEISIALGNGQSYRSLVKPVGGWDSWDKNLEAKHGISQWELQRFGKYPDQIANELNIICREHKLYSENWAVDHLLLNQLFFAAKVPCEIQLLSIETIVDESYIEDWANWKDFVAQVLGIDLGFCRGRDKARLSQTAIGLLYTEYGHDLDAAEADNKLAVNAA